MTKSKKPEPNPIEEAIGERAKDPKAQEKFMKEYQTEPIGSIPDEPSPSEMQTLEELNRRTVEKFQDNPMVENPLPTPPVSKPDLPPATETSSPESLPPQKTDSNSAEKPPTEFENLVAEEPPQKTESDERSRKAFEITKDIKKTNEQTLQEVNSGIEIEIPEGFIPVGSPVITSVEDIELTALKKYILEDGFVVSGVAMHIVMLCSQPLVTPSTTTWAFADRANIPDMVLAVLRTPGYLEGIWPSLKIVMGTNIGNAAWTAGIATTIAFFDCVRTLPALEELKKEKNVD